MPDIRMTSMRIQMKFVAMTESTVKTLAARINQKKIKSSIT